MAKKVNKKVVLIVLIVFGIMGLAAAGLGFKFLQERNPEYCLNKAQQTLEADDYQTAEKFFGRAVVFTKNDPEKIQRYFDLAEFHLIQNDRHEPNWRKALGCWSAVINIDPKHKEALQKLLDYFYEGADLGGAQLWKPVQEYSEKLLEVTPEGDPEYNKVLLAFARSNLAIAELGGTTTRQESLDEAVKDFNKLLEADPSDERLYLYLAQAAGVQAQIDEDRGLPNARRTANAKGLAYLEQAVAQNENNAAAWAQLFQFRLGVGDPNRIDALREEIAAKIRTLPPSVKLFMAQSASYDHTGQLGRREEMDCSIAAIREALRLEPDNVDAQLKLIYMLYRKGCNFEEPSLRQEAIETAEAALNLSDVRDIPGPRQSYRTQNRYRILSFLTRAYLEKALEARTAGKSESDITPWLSKAQSYSDSITQILGASEHLEVQKWQGIIALAEGKKELGLRTLYKAYQQAKALDRPNQPSQVDPFLCYILARQMSDEGLVGLRQEFLTNALFNRNSIGMEKPDAILDFCRILITTRSYPLAVRFVKEYETIYGVTAESRQIHLQAAAQGGFFEEAEEILEQMPADQADTLEGRFLLLQRKAASLRGQAADERDAAAKEKLEDQITAVEKDLWAVMQQLLETDPSRIRENDFLMLCRRQINQGNAAMIRPVVETYLKHSPQSFSVLLLRRELQEADPQAITAEQRQGYLLEVLQAQPDSVSRDLALGEHYLSSGQSETALNHFRRAYEKDKQSTAALRSYFEILLQTQAYDTAKELIQEARRLNIDGCEGGLLAAQLAFVQEDWAAALRRLEECLNLRPLLPEAYLLRSRVHLAQDNINGAVEAITTAVQMNPVNPSILVQWASILNERNRQLGSKVTQEQKQQALMSVRLALAFNSGNMELQSLYAELISEVNPLEGLAIRQRLFEIRPSTLYGIMLGNMAVRLSQQTDDSARREALMEIAGDAFKKAYELNPADEWGRNTYAEHLRRIGRGEEAVRLLESSSGSLWRFYLRDGQYEKAIEVLEKLHAENPDDYEVLQGLILAYQGQGDREKMKDYLGRILQKAATSQEELWVLQRYLDAGLADLIRDRMVSFEERYPDEPSILLLKGWHEMNSGNLEEALRLTNRFLENNTQHSGAWRLRGRIHRLMGQYREAVNALQRSKNINPEPGVQMELANVYLENKQVDVAIGELRDGMDQPQAPLQIRLMLEKLLKEQNRLTELKTFYRQTLEKYPESVFWLIRTGRFYLDQKDYALALPLMQKAWEQSRTSGPGNVEALDFYLETLFQSEQYDKLLSIANELVDGPFAPIVYAQLAQTQAKLGNTPLAVENYRKALDRAGNNGIILEGILTNLLGQIGPQVAVQWANEKISQDPASNPGRFILMKLAILTGQYNQAIEHLDRVIGSVGSEDPRWISYLQQKAEILGMAYVKTSDRQYLDDLTAAFEAILEKQPENVTVMNNLAYLLLDSNQQPQRALRYATEAVQRAPDNATFQDTYALALYRNDRPEEALKALLRSIQISEVSGEAVSWEVYKHQGMILEKLNKLTEALDVYQKSLDNPSTPEAERESLRQIIQGLTQTITQQSGNTGV